LDINKSEKKIINPDIIKCNLYNWQNQIPFEFFIDIETVNNLMGDFSTIPYEEPDTTIFLIGVGYIDKYAKWNFKKFVTHSLSYEEERRILIEFNNFILSITQNNNYRLFHWGHYEKTEFGKAVQRQNLETIWKLNEQNNCIMIDILKIMREEPIVVKGAFGFGLKDISKSMFKYGLIKNYYSTNDTNKNNHRVINGQGAMIAAWNCHKDALAKNVSMDELPLMKEIIKYNEMDCKLLYDIIEYLRNFHTNIPHPKNSKKRKRSELKNNNNNNNNNKSRKKMKII